jgi:hypothetical protein
MTRIGNFRSRRDRSAEERHFFTGMKPVTASAKGMATASSYSPDAVAHPATRIMITTIGVIRALRRLA